MRETLYGRQAVRESLRAKRRDAFRLMLAEGTISAPILDEILELAQARRVPTARLSRNEMESFTGTTEHQGVCLTVDSISHIAHLSPGGPWIADHRMKHLGGDYHRLAHIDTAGDYHPLNARYLLVWHFYCQVTAGNHNTV